MRHHRIQQAHSWASDLGRQNSTDTGRQNCSAALFTIVKAWKQLQCPSTDDWIKKMWYTYTMEYYSAIKKNKIM